MLEERYRKLCQQQLEICSETLRELSKKYGYTWQRSRLPFNQLETVKSLIGQQGQEVSVKVAYVIADREEESITLDRKIQAIDSICNLVDTLQAVLKKYDIYTPQFTPIDLKEDNKFAFDNMLLQFIALVDATTAALNLKLQLLDEKNIPIEEAQRLTRRLTRRMSSIFSAVSTSDNSSSSNSSSGTIVQHESDPWKHFDYTASPEHSLSSVPSKSEDVAEEGSDEDDRDLAPWAMALKKDKNKEDESTHVKKPEPSKVVEKTATGFSIVRKMWQERCKEPQPTQASSTSSVSSTSKIEKRNSRFLGASARAFPFGVAQGTAAKEQSDPLKKYCEVLGKDWKAKTAGKVNGSRADIKIVDDSIVDLVKNPSVNSLQITLSKVFEWLKQNNDKNQYYADVADLSLNLEEALLLQNGKCQQLLCDIIQAMKVFSTQYQQKDLAEISRKIERVAELKVPQSQEQMNISIMRHAQHVAGAIKVNSGLSFLHEKISSVLSNPTDARKIELFFKQLHKTKIHDENSLGALLDFLKQHCNIHDVNKSVVVAQKPGK